MKKLPMRLICAATFAAASIGTISVASADPPAVMPQTAPFGTPLPQWTAQWWELMLSLPLSVNPLADETGASCMIGQRGAVWFLAGNFGGTAAPSTRACSVPEGKALFFPVLNVVDVNTTTQSAGELRAETAPCLDAATELTVVLDGQAVSRLCDKHRVRSVVFELALPDGNLFGIPAGVYSPAIDDGFYVMLRPLSLGAHTLHIVGASAGCALLGTSGFSVDVTYNLDVVPVSHD